MISDKEILEVYMKGFNDELKGIKVSLYKDKLKQIAYSLGADQAVLGDDLPSSDYSQTDDVILEKIKRIYNERQ